MTTFSAECVSVAGQRMRLEGFPADDLHKAREFAESTLPEGALLLAVYEEPPGGCTGCTYQRDVLELDCHVWLLVRFIDTPKGTEASYNGELDPELCLRCVDEEEFRGP